MLVARQACRKTSAGYSPYIQIAILSTFPFVPSLVPPQASLWQARLQHPTFRNPRTIIQSLRVSFWKLDTCESLVRQKIRRMAERKPCFHCSGLWISVGEEYTDDAKWRQWGKSRESMSGYKGRVKELERIWTEQRRADPDWIEPNTDGS